MAQSVDGSASDSSSEESLMDVDEDEGSNANFVAHNYEEAKPRPPTQACLRAGLTKKAALAIGEAILTARTALLRYNWIKLAAAVKSLEEALKLVNSDKALGWRIPILSRLMSDIIVAATKAMRCKRSLNAEEARSLVKLKHKLPNDPWDTPWHRLEVAHATEHPYWEFSEREDEMSVLHSFELSLLSTDSDQLELSFLELFGLPHLVQGLPALVAYHESYSPLELGRDIFSGLHLNENGFSDLPHWLPQVLPNLTQLSMEGNDLEGMPPVLALFRQLSNIEMDYWEAPTNNSRELVDRAASIVAHKQQIYNRPRARVLPLSYACIDILKAADGIDEDFPSHLERWFEGDRYVCAGCQEHVLPDEDRWLSDRLVETIYQFDPPIKMSDNIDAYVTGCELDKPHKIEDQISSPKWRFCAYCLLKHCCLQTLTDDDEKSCLCMLCREERAALQEEGMIRWARKRIAL